MSEQTIQYKCPSCGAPLKYSTIGKLICEACGNFYDVSELSSIPDTQKKEQFDWGDYKKEFIENKTRLENRTVYVCRSCGAAIETDETTAATHCPYCDNEVILTDKLSGSIRPNYVIPFSVSKTGAIQSVKNHFKGKKLLPKKFLSEHVIDRIQGLYVPFWLFDSDVDGSVEISAETVRHYSDSEYRYTETSYYRIDIDGSMSFARIPVDGSEKMDDDLMDSLEPFDYSGLKAFDTAYLSGFLADRFDEDPDTIMPRASERMKYSAEAVLSSRASSRFTSKSITHSDMKLLKTTVKYALLPVYLLNIKYNKNNYRFAVNGQTGKTVGELPISKLKKFLHSWVYGGIVASIITLILYFLIR